MQVLHLGAARPFLGAPYAPAGAVAVGNFDGVHRGHQALVEAALDEARRRGRPSVALTFDPHPAQLLAPERAPRRLMTAGQKEEHLAALGLDVLAVLPFTRDLAAETPEAFARKVLAGGLGAGAVVVGESFRFGAGRRGDVALLRELGQTLGFEVRAVPAVVEDGAPVSSTRIREALAEGRPDRAARLLGRPPLVDGLVVAGEARGRTLGFPTANLATANEILPKDGVYVARVRLGGAGEPFRPSDEMDRPAVVNLGQRPTFGGSERRLEAHLLDFRGELYGRSLRVSFVARLRDEVRFDGPEALKAQLEVDVAAARRALAGRVIVPLGS